MFRDLVKENWEAIVNECKAADVEALRSPLNGCNIDVLIDKKR